MKPITPKEARKNKSTSFPDYVIQAFNEMISEKIDNSGEAVVMQNEVIERIMSMAPEGTTKESLFDKGWLDVEPIFRKAGWKVEYDKPCYNETYEASFTFSSKGKR